MPPEPPPAIDTLSLLEAMLADGALGAILVELALAAAGDAGGEEAGR